MCPAVPKSLTKSEKATHIKYHTFKLKNKVLRSLELDLKLVQRILFQNIATLRKY